MGESKNYGMNTKAIHTQKRIELPTGDVMPPIHLSTTYENTQPGEYEYFYGRSGNPTRELFERTMASLEGVDNHCLLYTSPSPRDVEESRMPSSA